MSFTMPYSKLYILIKLSANDVKFISVDKKKLNLSQNIYLRYGKFYICRVTARFYEHKNDPRYGLVCICTFTIFLFTGLIPVYGT